MLIWEYITGMARLATTADVFNAIAEPRRREIIDLLALRGAIAVGEIVERMRLPQPVVSKHLAVLRQVGLVTATSLGRRRVYRLEARELKAVHEWVKTYERFWEGQLDRIKERAERSAAGEGVLGTPGRAGRRKFKKKGS